MAVMASGVSGPSMEISLLPKDDLMDHARFGLGHAAKDAFPRLGLREPLGTGLAPAAPGRDRLRKKCAHLGDDVAGFTGQLNPDRIPSFVPDKPVRV